MKILVTGAAGFIGSHIADALVREGHKVLGIDNLSTGSLSNVNEKIEFHECDISTPEAARIIEKLRPEVICHQAAQVNLRHSVDDPVGDARSNVLGTVNIASVAARAGTRHIVFSSTGGAIYGDGVPIPTPVGSNTRPVSPYGAAKLSAEIYLSMFAGLKNLDVTCLRYANVYGPRQNPHGEAGVVAIFLTRWLQDQTPQINGNGLQTRDYVYVGDIVAANLSAIRARQTGTYNVGTGIETSVIELHDAMLKALGTGAHASHGPAKLGEQLRSCLDFSETTQDLGWTPTTSLEEGLQQTADWFRTLVRANG